MIVCLAHAKTMWLFVVFGFMSAPFLMAHLLLNFCICSKHIQYAFFLNVHINSNVQDKKRKTYCLNISTDYSTKIQRKS